MSPDSIVASALTIVVIVGAYAYWNVLQRLGRMEQRWRNLVHMLYEANRLLHPDKVMEMQELLRSIGENGDWNK